jgi:hypothetical protein
MQSIRVAHVTGMTGHQSPLAVAQHPDIRVTASNGFASTRRCSLRYHNFFSHQNGRVAVYPHFFANALKRLVSHRAVAYPVGSVNFIERIVDDKILCQYLSISCTFPVSTATACRLSNLRSSAFVAPAVWALIDEDTNK